MKNQPKTKKQLTQPVSITGRDGFIQNKALFYAIAAIQALPERRQEISDASDMARLIQAYVSPSMAAVYAYGVQNHMEREIDFEMFVDEDIERPAWIDAYHEELARMKRQIAESRQALEGGSNVIPFQSRAG